MKEWSLIKIRSKTYERMKAFMGIEEKPDAFLNRLIDIHRDNILKPEIKEEPKLEEPIIEKALEETEKSTVEFLIEPPKPIQEIISISQATEIVKPIQQLDNSDMTTEPVRFGERYSVPKISAIVIFIILLVMSILYLSRRFA
jgi:hypothetical protein